MFPKFTSKYDESHKPLFTVILIVKQPFSTAHLVMESCAILIIKCMKNMKSILYNAFFHADHEYTAAKDQLLFITF